MKKSSRDAIRVALEGALAVLKTAPVGQEGQWEYKRAAGGNWNGSFVLKPGGYSLFTGHDDLFDRLGQTLGVTLSVDYPDHMKVVGIATMAGVLDPRSVVTGLAYECFKRFGSFAISSAQMEALLDEVAGFFDRTTVRLTLSAPALNIHGPRDVPPVRFPGGITLRPITDEEFTRFYGGNPIFQHSSRMLNFPDFIFIREIEVPKVIGTYDGMGGDPVWKPTQELLDRCVLALATFKDGGAVGYDGVRIAPAELTLGSAFGLGHMWGNEHVPVGRYEITPDEATRLNAHALLFDNIHASLEMACQRLVDSGRRTKPRDGIVDAIIGLESILLVDIGEKQRGETRFRFSLNYASLFPATERKAAFDTARDLYDLRSKIAHGGTPADKEKINGADITLHEAAIRARAVLRETITRFMPNSAKPDFLADGYWKSRALGL